MKKKTLNEVAELIGGTVENGEGIIITGASGINEAREGDITFLADPRYAPLMESTAAAAVVVKSDWQVVTDKPLVRVEHPTLAFSALLDLFGPPKITFPVGVHETAIVSPNATLGKGVSIGPYAVIEDGAVIGDNTIIRSGVYIGHETRVGSGCHCYPNVVIRERCEIGDRVIIHCGTVIGGDGFGYVAIKQVHHKIPQIGKVVIEDDVEIGANVTVDRARFSRTIIREGTKIDNLVQIAHNCDIGEHSIVVAQVGISGSTVVGKNVILAGQVGVVGHVNIGDNTIIGAKGGVSRNVPANSFYIGIPAVEAKAFKKTHAATMRLPKLMAKVRELEEKVAFLEGGSARDAEAENN